MSWTSIAIFIFISTITLYLSFLLLGIGGISKNLKAQGIDKKN
tara:strand:+ start:935 stop:1063 length:129 start_codon:yes stop_codon:yes gene_type:complete